MKFIDLRRKADKQGVKLTSVYALAGLHRATYWRHRHGKVALSAETAARLSALIETAAAQKASEPWRELWRSELRREFVRLRKHRRLTQGDVEDRMGVTSALVGKYEANMKTPYAFLLCCWADSLGGTLRLIPNELLPRIDAAVEEFYAGRA